MHRAKTEPEFQAVRDAGLAHRASVLQVDRAIDLACPHIRCRHTRAILKAAAEANHQTASNLREAILAACPGIAPITEGELETMGGSGTKTGGGGGSGGGNGGGD